MAALLEAQQVTAGYDGRPVIRDISISVAAGEAVGILGSNGAGKSTTLRALVGEIPLLGGKVLWKGKATSAPLYVRAREGLGYLPEERSLFAELSVQENLRAGRGSVEAALEYFPELTVHLKRKANLLSGGQQQMLALARILACCPDIIVVDELSQGLAPLLVDRLFRALEEAVQNGAGMMVVEQHPRLVFGLVQRVYVVRRGEIVFSGAAQELKGDLDTLTALYLGSEMAE